MNRLYAPMTTPVLIAKLRAVTILVVLIAIFVLARVLLSVIPTQLALDLRQGYLAWPLLVIVLLLGYLGWRSSLQIGIPDGWTGSNALRTGIIIRTLLGLAVGGG